MTVAYTIASGGYFLCPGGHKESSKENALPLTDPSLGNGFSDLPVVFPHPHPGYARQRLKNLFPRSRDQRKGLTQHFLWPLRENDHFGVHCDIILFPCTDPFKGQIFKARGLLPRATNSPKKVFCPPLLKERGS